MTTQTTPRFFDAGTDLYTNLIDASVSAGERFARVARVWIDESLGVQRDLAQTVTRMVEDTQHTLALDDDPAGNPLAFAARSGDLWRSTAFLWIEALLKAQERLARVAQTALSEPQAAARGCVG